MQKLPDGRTIVSNCRRFTIEKMAKHDALSMNARLQACMRSGDYYLAAATHNAGRDRYRALMESYAAKPRKRKRKVF